MLHQLIGSVSHYLQDFDGFYTSQVVQDFFHQQYEWLGIGVFQPQIRELFLEACLFLFQIHTNWAIKNCLSRLRNTVPSTDL